MRQDPLTPAQRAKNTLKGGLFFVVVGFGLLVVACGILRLVMGRDFIGVKLVGFLILVMLALGGVGVVAGTFWTFKGLYRVIKTRQQGN